MADGTDFSELTQLAADLGEVAATAGPFINSALQHTAVEVKKGAAKKVGGRKHFKQAAGAIGFDVSTFQGFGASVLKIDVGYDKSKPAGELGNLVEFGAPGNKNALAPGNELVAALHENEADFEKGLDNALKDAERVLTGSTGVGNIAKSILRGGF